MVQLEFIVFIGIYYWIKNWSHVATHLVVVAYSCCRCCWGIPFL